MPQLVARQVKEKFGGLRLYVQAGSDVQRGMITLAEAMSHRICDLYGGPAKLFGPMPPRTRCDQHADALQR
ncbi:hypothetical protein BSFA1_76450 (plasmid) [Burkholderia sp. SFA1]|nr:hypothetical protein BSFA1_76450 [Burkholderia sp. SFA1]